MKITNQHKVRYSDILIRFIEPLLDGNEDEDLFLMKAKAGMIAWNYSVSDENELPINAEMKGILKAFTKKHAEAREILNELVIRKATLFHTYDQFIFKVELRIKPDGSKTLYVESAPTSVL